MNPAYLIATMLCVHVSVLGQNLTDNQKNDSSGIRSKYYTKLANELNRYRSIQMRGGWGKIKTTQKKWQLGDSADAIKKIKGRLKATAERNESDTTAIFNDGLVRDIIGYQRRNGIKQDGKVGRETLNEMNITAEERIRQIELNIERLLQLPEELGDKYIMVNIPAFRLLAMKGNKPEFICKIVAGKETDKTALFKGKMKYIVFGPYWNVPKSIMHKEILPALKRNPNYLRDNNMEWHDGKIRQRPGPGNALGKVKFIFPNAYNMYMHDTPAKTLFNEEKRAFSHGCIRVSEPLKLALFLLEPQKEWSESKINDAMESEEEIYVYLQENIPVYIVYFTAFIDVNGELNFRKDVYGRDNYLYF